MNLNTMHFFAFITTFLLLCFMLNVRYAILDEQTLGYAFEVFNNTLLLEGMGQGKDCNNTGPLYIYK